VGPLRTKLKLRAFKDSVRGLHQSRSDFRVVHFSLQGSHLHLIVEARDRRALSCGLRALEIRIARRFNRLTERTGRVFSDRYHARPLKTLREVRVALAYVLLNSRHHARHAPRRAWLDPCSSAASFDGWSRPAALPPDHQDDDPACTATAETWLLRIGWRRRGETISPDQVPGRP
jgi:REP element-mobilizing transposase RayT